MDSTTSPWKLAKLAELATVLWIWSVEMSEMNRTCFNITSFSSDSTSRLFQQKSQMPPATKKLAQQQMLI
jgi:hypothetical protein